jgi:hypothetical protein
MTGRRVPRLLWPSKAWIVSTSTPVSRRYVGKLQAVGLRVLHALASSMQDLSAAQRDVHV